MFACLGGAMARDYRVRHNFIFGYVGPLCLAACHEAAHCHGNCVLNCPGSQFADDRNAYIVHSSRTARENGNHKQNEQQINPNTKSFTGSCCATFPPHTDQY